MGAKCRKSNKNALKWCWCIGVWSFIWPQREDRQGEEQWENQKKNSRKKLNEQSATKEKFNAEIERKENREKSETLSTAKTKPNSNSKASFCNKHTHIHTRWRCYFSFSFLLLFVRHVWVVRIRSHVSVPIRAHNVIVHFLFFLFSSVNSCALSFLVLTERHT